MKKLVALRTKEKGKMAMNKWENGDSEDFQALYSIFEKLGQYFFHIYSLTCLNKDISFVKCYKYLNKFIS